MPYGVYRSRLQTNWDLRKATYGYVFSLECGVVTRRTLEYKCIADSKMEAEYVGASDVAKEVVWLRNFLIDFNISLSMTKSINMYCDC